MTYVIGSIAGLVFGGVIGVLKDIFIWRRYVAVDPDTGKHKASDNSLYGRMMASYMINIVTLLAAFLVRNIVPFDWIAFLIATAIALSIANHVGAIFCKKAAG